MEVTKSDKESELVLEFSDEEYEDYLSKKTAICEVADINIDDLSNDILILGMIERALDDLNDVDFYALLKKKIADGI